MGSYSASNKSEAKVVGVKENNNNKKSKVQTTNREDLFVIVEVGVKIGMKVGMKAGIKVGW